MKMTISLISSFLFLRTEKMHMHSSRKKLNREKGITIVLITHHMEEAAEAQRVVVLHKGKIAADGTPKEVFRQVELLHSIGLAAPETVELCHELNGRGAGLPMDAISPEECAQALYDWVKA